MEIRNKYKSPREKRFRNNGIRSFPGERLSKIDEEAGANLTGDNEQLRTGLSPDGEFARFEFAGFSI